MMIVHCDTTMAFQMMIAAAVREGLTFEAHTAHLTITYTGGY